MGCPNRLVLSGVRGFGVRLASCGGVYINLAMDVSIWHCQTNR